MLDADELLRRCQRGDEAALADLICLFEGRIFRLACRVTGDPARAEAATVDALARVWLKSGQWRGESSAGTWIYRVALRSILDAQRTASRSRSWLPVTEEIPDYRSGPAETAIEAESRDRDVRRIESALAGLSAADRALVHLFYFEERGLTEIAVILDTSRDSLKMRLSRARDRLRDLLRECDERA